MSPVVMVFFSYVAAGIVTLFCAVCLGVFINGWRKKYRFLLWSGGIPLVLCLMGASFLIFQDSITPLDTQGRALMRLPAEAKVINVEHGDWSGDGVVYFKLPPTHSNDDWLDAVRKMNAPPTTAERGETDFTIPADEGRRKIEYEESTKLYRYEVELDN